jgi:hypothetical protein
MGQLATIPSQDSNSLVVARVFSWQEYATLDLKQLKKLRALFNQQTKRWDYDKLIWQNQRELERAMRYMRPVEFARSHAGYQSQNESGHKIRTEYCYKLLETWRTDFEAYDYEIKCIQSSIRWHVKYRQKDNREAAGNTFLTARSEAHYNERIELEYFTLNLISQLIANEQKLLKGATG